MTIEDATDDASKFGVILRDWRKARGWSQMRLAGEAELSARHIAFLENHRARPSRASALRLAAALKLPARETNALLNAAGYLAQYNETPLDAPELGGVRRAIDLFLQKMEPYPALILNRRWEAIDENQAAIRHARLYRPELDSFIGRNILLFLFSPDGLQPFVENWPVVSGCLLRRLSNEIGAHDAAAGARRLISTLTAFPTTPNTWRSEPFEDLPPVLSLEFRNDHKRTRFITTLSTFGAAQDLTVQDLRMEAYFPADAATKDLLERLAAEQPAPAAAVT